MLFSEHFAFYYQSPGIDTENSSSWSVIQSRYKNGNVVGCKQAPHPVVSENVITLLVSVNICCSQFIQNHFRINDKFTFEF